MGKSHLADACRCIKEYGGDYSLDYAPYYPTPSPEAVRDAQQIIATIKAFNAKYGRDAFLELKRIEHAAVDAVLSHCERLTTDDAHIWFPPETEQPPT